VYLDNAATTMMDDEVVGAMLPYLQESFGNPETPYHLGRVAAEAVDEARERIAEVLGADTGEIVFTSGGTESNNWAIKCAGFVKEGKVDAESGRTIPFCSLIEHSSVLECVKGVGVLIPVDKKGHVVMEFLKALDDRTRIVSVQHCNNEIGTVQDIAEIARVVHAAGAILHVDAVQSFGKWKWDVDDLGADLVSVSAHKIHGPMGIGALWIKSGTPIFPLLSGGGQETERRSGTLAVPSIVGFGMAAEQARTTMSVQEPRVRSLRDRFLAEAELKFGVTVNGDRDSMAPHIASITFPDVEAGVVAAVLNRHHGICVACGSACATRGGPSHVLKAIGKTVEESHRTLRVSLSRFTTDRHVRSLISGIHMAVREAKERSLD
jgi:cysteine desulfurase